MCLEDFPQCRFAIDENSNKGIETNHILNADFKETAWISPTPTGSGDLFHVNELF
jgi:hypothetical protein